MLRLIIVKIFNSHGKFLRQIGGSGQGPGEITNIGKGLAILNKENISEKIGSLLGKLYNGDEIKNLVQLQKTKKDFDGDFTLVVFPLLKFSKKSPDETGQEIGDYLTKELTEIKAYNVVKGFLNLVMQPSF